MKIAPIFTCSEDFSSTKASFMSSRFSRFSFIESKDEIPRYNGPGHVVHKGYSQDEVAVVAIQAQQFQAVHVKHNF